MPTNAGSFDVLVHATGPDVRYRLFIDNKLILNSWEHSIAAVDYATVSLEAGPHKIVLEHFRQQGGGSPRFRLGIVARNSVVDADAKKMAASADAVVLAVGFDPESEREGSDRTFRLPPGQEQLIQEVAAANRNTVVVITAGGGVDMTSWIDHVAGVLQAWYPGQEGGTALAEILFGEVNPSGRLPVSFERAWFDNPVHDSYYPEAGTNRIVYKEGVFVGYRGYDDKGVRPLFPFGYGMSYTSFSYRNLTIATGLTKGGSAESWWAKVSFDLTNTGKREGAEVAQVYIGSNKAKVPRPRKELKGFAKVRLRPGETKRVTVMLDQRALSYYDVDVKRWRVDPGDFDVLVGRSSDQTELKGKLSWRGP